jgi:hypothetical protein
VVNSLVRGHVPPQIPDQPGRSKGSSRMYSSAPILRVRVTAQGDGPATVNDAWDECRTIATADEAHFIRYMLEHQQRIQAPGVSQLTPAQTLAIARFAYPLFTFPIQVFPIDARLSHLLSRLCRFCNFSTAPLGSLLR